ncbi:MAG TPA: PPK2 family polyphosphate kinase [Chloroflexota bacterium]|jgi:PPK2 family polyphosphate:nucleotide phosphotransferase|nr:PPK2 family polyphosphate kinase [Chloroflexota bacterium]
MGYALKLDAGQPISLADHDPGSTAGLHKDEAERRLEALSEELGQLQELCYAAAHHGVLIVLQGMDTSGKDGTIEHVMRSVNPQGCRIVSFKVPTELELSHDFLWRVHAAAPERGMITIFNRSHYEDVLVARVRKLVPEAVWRARYAHINHFERLLTDNATIVLKFFLHISLEEQAERLAAREREVDKRWKLNVGDYQTRREWPAYMAAYEDALRECATEWAPWYVVPADKKWFRNLAVAQAVVETLRTHKDTWREALRERGQRQYEALLAARAKGEALL